MNTPFYHADPVENMEDDDVCGKQREQEGTTSAGTTSAWMRRHLTDSIYLWACGEKADEDDDEPKLSDALIGWLILFMQGFAYTMLIVLARATPTSDPDSSTDDSGQSSYLLPSVTGAMYMLVASTIHDLQAGYWLLVNGDRAGHRTFGIGLLIVYGIMMGAAMTVLVSTSNDSASVVLNAVTVLFIADLDEKALKFLLSVPQKWRLFWAIESMSISFALALVAMIYIGDSSPLLRGNNGVLKAWPTGFIWMLNPTAATVTSVVLSSSLQAFCNFCSEASEGVDEPTVGLTFERIFRRTCAIVRRGKQRFRGQPWFYIARMIWLAQIVPNWIYMASKHGYPLAFVFAPITAPTTESPTSENHSIAITDNKLILLFLNAVLAIGLGLKALGVFLTRRERVTVVPEGRMSLTRSRRLGGWRSCADSRVSSLLIGWGLGFWVTSLLYVLVCSWHGADCGWTNAPLVVTIISYAVYPCFLVTGIFMVADANVLGTKLGAVVNPVVDILRNRDRVEYWLMVSVFRDFLVIWIVYCDILRSQMEFQL